MDIDGARQFQRNVPHQLNPAAVAALCRDIRKLMKTATKGLDPQPPVEDKGMDVRDVYRDDREVGTFVTKVMASVLTDDVLNAVTDVEVQAEHAVPGPREPFERLQGFRTSLAKVIQH